MEFFKYFPEMTLIFNLSLIGYCAALLLSAVDHFSSRRQLVSATTAFLAAGAAAQTGYLVWRWIEAGRAPFSNMFESLVLFAWALVVVYFIFRPRRELPMLAGATALLALLALAYASTFGSEIRPLMPALQSNWLTFHVFTCFLGYGAFALAFMSGIGYLAVLRGNGSDLDGVLESITARANAFGFLFLTLGIITGAVWANAAWGTYWSWDPKETWSLVTWLIYAVFLHCRYMRGWAGKRAVWISTVGFTAMVFTYFGVNFLLSGLHSYAT